MKKFRLRLHVAQLNSFLDFCARLYNATYQYSELTPKTKSKVKQLITTYVRICTNRKQKFNRLNESCG